MAVTRPAITRIRDLVRSLNEFVSIHAAEELDDDNLAILDLENIILTSKIIEHQRDAQRARLNVLSAGSRSATTQPKSSSKLAQPVSSSSLPFTLPGHTSVLSTL